MSMLIALKALLTPTFIGLVSIAGRRWGSWTAGWLAGMPVVVGPILFLLWIAQGPVFGRQAAAYSLVGVLPTTVFCVTYARTCHLWKWPLALLSAYFAWLIAASVMLILPNGVAVAGIAAASSLLCAPKVMPVSISPPERRTMTTGDLLPRMLAGLALTLVVTSLSQAAGSRVSGLLAVFPLISAVLAVFTHRSVGADTTISMLSGLLRGLYSLAAFCLTLAALSVAQTASAFSAAILISVAVQGIVAHWRSRKHSLAFSDRGSRPPFPEDSPRTSSPVEFR